MSKTFIYDANGNLAADGTRTFEWDAENRLTAIVIGANRSEFTYDGLDRRVRIVEKQSGTTVRDAKFIWAGVTIVEERLSTGEINRFFEEAEEHDGVERYLTRDHLGSIREVSDSTGSILTRNEYDPYGRRSRVLGSENSRRGYSNHYAHEPSGLVLTFLRGYDAGLGRWLSEDPAGLSAGTNLSSYVVNDPISRIDPLGDDWQSAGGNFIGGLLGGVAATIGTGVGMAAGGLLGGAAAAASVGLGAYYTTIAVQESVFGFDPYTGRSLSTEERIDSAAGLIGGLIGGGLAGRGAEYSVGGGRAAPLGNRTGNPRGELPHYHRRVPDPNNPGQSLPGQGIGRHRPWDKKSTDKSFCDRF